MKYRPFFLQPRTIAVNAFLEIHEAGDQDGALL
jgi:hypothetical protein